MQREIQTLLLRQNKIRATNRHIAAKNKLSQRNLLSWRSPPKTLKIMKTIKFNNK